MGLIGRVRWLSSPDPTDQRAEIDASIIESKTAIIIVKGGLVKSEMDEFGVGCGSG